MIVAKPFIKYAGSKRASAHRIVALAPKTINHYREPFVGGGAVFFALRNGGYDGPATLSDVNRNVVAAYRVVRDHPWKLIAELKKHVNTEEHYYTVREAVSTKGGDPYSVAHAARVIFLNKTCFNGLWRENASGGMNSPFGDYDKPNFCDEDGILTASTALKGVKVQCADFAQGEANKGDFIYCDPPYLPSSATSNFAGYSAGGFGMVSHVRLRDFALACGRVGATVVLSNADVPTARKLYAQEHGFRRQRLMIGRSINPNGKGRGAVGELLITLDAE